MTAWIVRAGVGGERDEWALQNGLAGGGFVEFPDMTAVRSRDDVRAVADRVLAGRDKAKIANAVGQVWALRARIVPGDLVVLPLKTGAKTVALGVCTGGYEYDAAAVESQRHSLRVDWVAEAPRSAFKDDLLNTINGAMTVFSAWRNDAESRLRAVMTTGVDPGARGVAVNAATTEDLVDPTPAITPESLRDGVRTHLTENFSKHKLTGLVADILRALGYTCTVSPEGPDGGIDILAGSGPLGLDSPTVIVEVKSEGGAVGAPVLRGLVGAVTSHHADQALLVARGGLNKQAEMERRTQRLKVQVWNDEDLLDWLFETYDRLPETTRQAIPLKRAWVLVQETG